MIATIAEPIAGLVDEASGYIGVSEDPRGSNRGVYIDSWNLEAIRDWYWARGAPWCASFMTAMGCRALGQAWPVRRTASVQAMVDWANSLGASSGVWHPPPAAPQVGDLFVLYYPSRERYGHVGLVTGVEAGSVRTVEGNTNPGGGREGYAVLERTRPVTERMGFIRWVLALGGNATMFVSKGDSGQVVEYYQRKLERVSPESPGWIDGEYGPKTAASVHAFQQSRTPPVEEGTEGDYIGPWTKSELDQAETE